MNISKLSYRNIIDRPLSSILSLLLLTLGVGIILTLLHINHHIQNQLENNIRGIGMVVGAKGSPLQLILSAIYHIDNPTGNIPLEEAEKLTKNPLVAKAIPLAYGDSYEGYRIVGTDHKYINLHKASLKSGKLWGSVNEVTIGANVAQNLELAIGDEFEGVHGLSKGGESHEGDVYKIVGILKPSGSVVDQLILTAVESVWEVHADEEGDETEDEHGHSHASEKHNEHQITAMLIKFRSPMGMVQMPRIVNESTNMQAAVPAYEISRLFTLMGVGLQTLNTLAFVIIAVSGLSVFISLYNALKDRKNEMALMRTYGATRWQLVRLVVQEGLLLTLSGYLLGIVASRIGLWVVSGAMEQSYHYSFSHWYWLNDEGWLFLITTAIGLLASLIPALQAFRINISKTLSHV
ncbi:MAG: FtsX-like permease family protein [Fulvivirga sp.]